MNTTVENTGTASSVVISMLTDEQKMTIDSIKKMVKKRSIALGDEEISKLVTEFGLKAQPTLATELLTANAMGIQPYEWLEKKLTRDPVKLLSPEARTAHIRCDRNIGTLNESFAELRKHPSALKVYNFTILKAELEAMIGSQKALVTDVAGEALASEPLANSTALLEANQIESDLAEA